MAAQTFHIDIDQQVLDDLHLRLGRTRWTDEVESADWEYGTNLAYLKELATYWDSQFNWRAQEKMLNRFAHFRADVDGFGVHFIHERGKGNNPLPIVLTHGWPDSFFRMIKIIPMLTDPVRFGGDTADSFDVVVASIPGYGFSDRPHERGMNLERVADLWAALMRDILGYSQYAAHGGDVGSSVTQALAQRHADQLVGIHMTDVPYMNMYKVDPSKLSEPEKKYIQEGQRWGTTEGAYAMLQSTKPQTLAYGLNDSPVGLASWIVEKFRGWSDCNGNVENRFTKDELLTNITIYWVTQTINSSIRMYYEWQHKPQEKQDKQAQQRIEVPTAVAMFPKDLISAPREFGERFFNIQRWTEMPKGGHFAALEEPELLVDDIRTFFRTLRQSR
jgi:pimeloyl-ACP methyl ester carboxylesterase